MSRTMVRATFLVAMVLSYGMLAFAYPKKPLHLRQLIETSDCVAVINVTDVNDGGKISININGRTIEASAQTLAGNILRTIKGSCPAQLTIKSYTPFQYIGCPGLKAGVQIAFLRSAEGGFTFEDRQYPSLPATSDGPAGLAGPTSTPVDAVAAELAAVLSSSTEPPSEKWAVLAISYALPGNEVMTSSLRAAIRTAGNLAEQNRIEAELIQRGDVPTTESVATRILSNELAADAQALFLQVIANHLTAPGTAPSILRLLESKAPEVRRAAVEALWHIADIKNSQALGNSLADPDLQVRYYAVRGLADIHHQPEWGPTQGLFDRDSAYYVNHWSTWVKAQ